MARRKSKACIGLSHTFMRARSMAAGRYSARASGNTGSIFGNWNRCPARRESPNGPFVYWMMDDRPWKEIERINRQDAQTAAAARAANR